MQCETDLNQPGREGMTCEMRSPHQRLIEATIKHGSTYIRESVNKHSQIWWMKMIPCYILSTTRLGYAWLEWAVSFLESRFCARFWELRWCKFHQSTWLQLITNMIAVHEGCYVETQLGLYILVLWQASPPCRQNFLWQGRWSSRSVPEAGTLWSSRKKC